MKRAASFALFFLLCAGSLPARADDVRIYRGVIRGESFAASGTDSTVTNAYAVIDYTTRQVTLVAYQPELLTHNETTLDFSFAFEQMPFTPVGKSSRTFLYAVLAPPGVAVDLYRFVSTGKPSMQPVSSVAALLTAKSLSYRHDFAAPAAYNSVETATFKYQKALTIASNDASSDLAGATQVVLAYLQAHGLIN